MRNYEKYFSEIETPEPPEGLARAIIARIERRERRILILKLAGTIAAFGASLAVIWIGFADFTAGVASTGFFEFASLIFTDFSAISSNFSDFFFSILESFPAFSAAAVLAGTGFAIWSITEMFKEFSLVERYRFSFER